MFSMEQEKIIEKQITENGLRQKHKLIRIEQNIIKQALKQYDLQVRSMGRGLEDDFEFFHTCSVAAIYGSSILSED